MNPYRIVKLFLAMTLVATSVQLLADQSQEQTTSALNVIKQVDTRYRGNTWDVESSIKLVDKNGSESIRVLKLLGMMEGKDEKMVAYVLEPSRLMGTAILTYDWDDPSRQNESWLYLPDLGATTRLTTSNRADYFLGTDFTYGDMEGLEVEDFTYQMVSHSPQANSAQVIAHPLDDSIVDKYGYRQVEYWVDLDKKVVTKAKYSLKNPGWDKYFSQFDFKKIDGVWMSQREQMIMVKNGQKVHTTIIDRGEVKINSGVDVTAFNKSSLERIVR